MRIRTGTPDDARLLAEIAAPGFESYRAFGPPSYVPPTVEFDAALLREALEKPEYWCRIAEDDEGPLGQVGFPRKEIEPGLVHFQRLFVLRRAWGSGVASRLMSLAVDEMRTQGFLLARLFTPAGQERARRFYEREGWRAHGDPFPEARLGDLPVVEYRLTL